MESILILLVQSKEGFVVPGVHSYSTRSVTKEGFVVPWSPFLFYSFSD